MVKIWLITVLLFLPALAYSEDTPEAHQPDNSATEQGAEPEDSEDDPSNWVDDTHAYATNQAQALTEWMDSFFYDPDYEFETPESLLRLEWINSWDEKEDDRTKIRLRGKVQLPGLSRRLNLVFSGEENESIVDDETDTEGSIGLRYNLGEGKRSRFDLTLGVSSSDLTPGVRYRNQAPLNDLNFYRYTQRVEWKDEEGFFTTGEVDLDHLLSSDKLIRWSNRAIYGEETEGVEWRSRLSLRHRVLPENGGLPLAVSYFGSVKGVTDPSFVKAYRFGFQLRRQVYRKFLFVEVEPSYRFQKKKDDQDRFGAWKFVVRLEVALHRDLMKSSSSDD